jgi:hypothetical protein
MRPNLLKTVALATTLLLVGCFDSPTGDNSTKKVSQKVSRTIIGTWILNATEDNKNSKEVIPISESEILKVSNDSLYNTYVEDGELIIEKLQVTINDSVAITYDGKNYDTSSYTFEGDTLIVTSTDNKYWVKAYYIPYSGKVPHKSWNIDTTNKDTVNLTKSIPPIGGNIVGRWTYEKFEDNTTSDVTFNFIEGGKLVVSNLIKKLEQNGILLEGEDLNTMLKNMGISNPITIFDGSWETEKTKLFIMLDGEKMESDYSVINDTLIISEYEDGPQKFTKNK